MIGMFYDKIKYATRAIELNPLHSDVYYDRAFSYKLIGDKENMIRDLRMCLSIQPEAMNCKEGLAEYALWINDFQNADKYIAEMEQRFNVERSAYASGYQWGKSLRALYFAKLGKKDQALALNPAFLDRFMQNWGWLMKQSN